MNVQSTDSQIVKSVGASGQISLGKEFAGRQIFVESPAKGVWIIRTATIIPDHEEWLAFPQISRQIMMSKLKWRITNAAIEICP